LSLRSNPGLKLANAFGVKGTDVWANAFGVKRNWRYGQRLRRIQTQETSSELLWTLIPAHA